MTQPFKKYPVEWTDAERAHDTDTIEMELTPEQLLGLNRAAAAAQSTATTVEWTASPVPSTAEPAPPSMDEPSRELVCVSPPAVNVQPTGIRRTRRVAVIATLAVVSIASGGVAYRLATQRPAPVHVAAPVVSRPITPAPAVTQPVLETTTPVRFKNPFDAREVFEFPSGTSEAEARDAVATLLLERARERHVPQTARSRKKSDQDTTVAATSMVQRN